MSKTKLTFKGCHRCGEQIGWDETPNPICSDCAVERITELEAENAKLRKCVKAADRILLSPDGGIVDEYEAAREEVDK